VVMVSVAVSVVARVRVVVWVVEATV